MDKYTTYDPPIKFRENYAWPEKGTLRNCPRCDTQMQLNDNDETYLGKPWWCPKCQWQFSEKELADQD